MGKTAPSRKRAARSKHSREARRASSPSINTDKSLKDVKLPQQCTERRPSVLAVHQGAGVTKKASKGRHMSSKARRKAEREQDRGLAVMERTKNKIARSKRKAHVTASRAKTWDEINKDVPRDHKTTEGRVINEEAEEEEKEEVSVFDDEMKDSGGENVVLANALRVDDATATARDGSFMQAALALLDEEL